MNHSSNVSALWRAARQSQASGLIAEAERKFRQIVEAEPAFHPAWHTLALLAVDSGELSQAAEMMEKAISLDRQQGIYHRNQCEILRRLGRLAAAETAGAYATGLLPEDLGAHYNLGLVFTDAKKYDEAIACYRRALELDPNHGLSWNNLGSALEQKGGPDARSQARQAYEHAIALDAAHAEAQNNLGAILAEMGELESAERCFKAAIEARADFVDAHYNHASLHKYQRDDQYFAALEAVYAGRETLPMPARIRYAFALGKARDDIGDFDHAFEAYAEGNRLQHAMLPLDEVSADRVMQGIIDVFDHDFFAERRHWQAAPRGERTPIFIVGMPRSGTTLLEQILCSHASVHGAGELIDLSEVINAAAARVGGSHATFCDAIARLTEIDFSRIGSDYLDRVWQLSPDSCYITDKMPANFFYLGLIHLALPNAKIIHAMRDPMDSCFSCYSRLFNDTMAFAYDLETLGRYYVRYQKIMQHWNNVLPAGTILDLPYEDMVANTEAEARRVLEFVGLPWDENCLNFHQNRRPVKTASVSQVRQPIYKSSVARWKLFAKHLYPLYELVRDWRSPTDHEETEKLFQSHVPVGGDVASCLQRATQLQTVGRNADAETILEALLQRYPSQPQALHLLGILLFQRGAFARAQSLLANACEAAPGNALFHSNFAEVQRQLGNRVLAIEYGRRAVALDPAMAAAHSNLGVAYYDTGDFDRARACHLQALSLQPSLVQSLNNLGSIEKGLSRHAAAAGWYRQALSVQPDYVASMSNLGAVLAERGQLEEAAYWLERALALKLDFPEALCALADVRLQQNRVRDAHQLAEAALRINPQHADALIIRDRCLQGTATLETM